MKKWLIYNVLLVVCCQTVIAQFSVKYDSLEVKNRDTIDILPRVISIECLREDWDVSSFHYRFTKGKRILIDTIMVGDSLILKDTLDYRSGRVMLEVKGVTNQISGKKYTKMRHFHINYFNSELFIPQSDSCGFRINNDYRLGYSTHSMVLDSLKSVELVGLTTLKQFTVQAVIGERPIASRVVGFNWSRPVLLGQTIKKYLTRDVKGVRLILSDLNNECFASIILKGFKL